MIRSTKLSENEKGALLCFVILVMLFMLSVVIFAKLFVGSGVVENVVPHDRAFSGDANEFLETLSAAAVRFAPTALLIAVSFMLADSVFLFPVSAVAAILRGTVAGISFGVVRCDGDFVQVVFYGAVSILYFILMSRTVGFRMALPCGVRPQRYLVESYLIFSGICFVGELLLPIIL